MPVHASDYPLFDLSCAPSTFFLFSSHNMMGIDQQGPRRLLLYASIPVR